MKSSAIKGLAAAALLAVGTSANAVPISGSISFGGSWAPTGGTGIADATGVDVLGNLAVVTCALANACTGAYTAINGSVIVATYSDFQFAPLSAPVPLWTFTEDGVTYSFEITSVTVVDQNTQFLNLLGSGIARIEGGAIDYVETEASWSFSADTSDLALLAFSSTTSIQVPEPGALALMALGLLGLGFVAARRQRG